MREKHNNVLRHFTRIMLLCPVFFITGSNVFAQTNSDSLISRIDPERLSSSIERKVSKLEKQIVAKSEKTLIRMQKEEEKVYKKLIASRDSLEAKARLAEIREHYATLTEKIKNPIGSKSLPAVNDYIPNLDTLSTALKFLGNNNLNGNIKETLSKVESLNGRLQQADEIKQFISERKEQIKQAWSQLGIAKDLTKINKDVYYYSQQIKEYKEILKDPKKIERKAIELLSKTKAFQDFIKKNSLLASMFRIPNDPNSSVQASLAGLQTRAQINSLVQSQISSGGANGLQSFQQNVQQAQAQLQQLKDKINKIGGGGNSKDIMPEGFKPNNQKTKSFLQRLELGTNIQTQKTTNFFPSISDIGLSVGYKLNDRSIIGLGTSLKVGWGTGWNNIHITQEGLSFRSFIDWKLKGTLWITGGYEQNLKTALSSIDQIRDISAWQQSGLLGLSKVLSVRSKLFKKTKMQLLWDFLSYQQVPRSQPLIFRIGYSFK